MGFRPKSMVPSCDQDTLHAYRDPGWEESDKQELKILLDLVRAQNSKPKDKARDFLHVGDRWIYAVHLEKRRELYYAPADLKVKARLAVTHMFRVGHHGDPATIYPGYRVLRSEKIRPLEKMNGEE